MQYIAEKLVCSRKEKQTKKDFYVSFMKKFSDETYFVVTLKSNQLKAITGVRIL